MTGLCEAKMPVAVFPRTWRICGEPSTAVYTYTCGCGWHSRRGETCEAHRPVEGEVGCSQCWDQGYECPMEFMEVVPVPVDEVPRCAYLPGYDCRCEDPASCPILRAPPGTYPLRSSGGSE